MKNLVKELYKDINEDKDNLEDVRNLVDGWVEFIKRPEAEKYLDELEGIIADMVKADWGTEASVEFNRTTGAMWAKRRNKELKLT